MDLIIEIHAEEYLLLGMDFGPGQAEDSSVNGLRTSVQNTEDA